MSSNINTVLADCEKQAEELVAEISKFRTAGAISDQTAKSLQAMCAALGEVQKKIYPFTQTFSRRVLYIIGGMLVANLVLLIAILAVLFLKK